VEALQNSTARGMTPEWVVSAWSTNGDVSNVAISLTTGTPSLTPEFSFGCGSYDGTASCSLGTVYSSSSARQVIATVPIPASATATSVKLTAAESATGLTAAPSASVSIPVSKSTSTTTSSSTTPDAGTGTGSDGSTVSQLPVGSLPAIGGNGATSSISPGGNAAGLFPTINPSGSGSGPGQGESARQVADSEALPIGTPVIDAQVIGLVALAVAFLLAVTRLSVRRRPAAAMAGGRGAAAAAALASVAPTRVETAGPAATSADDATRDDLASGVPADDKAAGEPAETRDDIKAVGAPPWELGNEE